MHEDSCIGINYAHTHMFPKCFRSLHTLLGFALCFVSSILILVAVTIHSILTCTRIPCRDSHCENVSFEVLSLLFCPTNFTAFFYIVFGRPGEAQKRECDIAARKCRRLPLLKGCWGVVPKP